MIAVRHRFPTCPLLLLSVVIGCDRSQPLEPTVQMSPSVRAGAAGKAPSSLAIISLSAGRIDVSWQDNSSNETGFEVHRSATGPEGAFALRGVSNANATTYADAGPGVDAFTPYCYKVRALRVVAGRLTYSEYSNAVCAAAGDVAVTATTVGVDQDTDGYWLTLEAITEVGVLGVSSARVPPNGTVGFSGLRAGAYYHVSLRRGFYNVAPNCEVSGPDTQAVTVVAGGTTAVAFAVTCVQLTPPAAPSGLTAEGYFGVISLAWQDNANNEGGFRIERCLLVTCSDEDFVLIAFADPTPDSFATYFVYDSQPPGTYYTYRIRATNLAGESAPSNHVAATTCGVDDLAPCN